jgi:D-3-phosphoglycerate dehydrogenase / 2-oxoglutarate reductase
LKATPIRNAEVVTRPVIVTPADLTHLPETRGILESAATVRYISPTPEALASAISDAHAYFASLHVQLTRELIERAPLLVVVCTPSTGLDHIDVKAAVKRGITVLSLKDDRDLLDRITSTAELAWALLLACARRLPEAIDASRRGHWARDELRGHQIAYKTLGILGMGRLGTMMAGYGQAFRMQVLGCDILPIRKPGVEGVSFDELFERSDVVSIHVHLTDQTRGLVNSAALARMKPGSILINTSRGAIVDEPALLDALQHGPLATAGLDVIEGEWRQDLDQHPLILHARTHGNLVITPHLGGVTFEGQEMACSAAARRLADFLRKHVRIA